MCILYSESQTWQRSTPVVAVTDSANAVTYSVEDPANVYVRIPDGHAKARFAGEYKPEVFWGLSSEYSPQNTWRAASGCWLYLDKNDYWMITDNEIEVGPHSSRGHIHSKEKARGRAPTEMRAWVSHNGKAWQDAPEILVEATVTTKRAYETTKASNKNLKSNKIKSI